MRLAKGSPYAMHACIVSGVVAALAIYVAHRPILGTVVLAVSFLAAALARMTLSERAVGLLSVRSRRTDAFFLGALGVAMLLLTLSLRHTYQR